MCVDNCNGGCPMLGLLHSLRRFVGTSSAVATAPPPELPEWLQDLPQEVCLCTSNVPGLAYSICVAQRIQQDIWIGPFQGVVLPPEKVHPGAVRKMQHLWDVSHPLPSTLPPARAWWVATLGRASFVSPKVAEIRFLRSLKSLVHKERCAAGPCTTGSPGPTGFCRWYHLDKLLFQLGWI